jgi:putative hemolysin
MKKYFIFSSFLFLIIFLAGCNQQSQTSRQMQSEKPGASPTEAAEQAKDQNKGELPAGIANPASTFCIENGWTLEIEETAEGATGYCFLPDDTKCEEWALYRGECGQEFLAPAEPPPALDPSEKTPPQEKEASAEELELKDLSPEEAIEEAKENFQEMKKINSTEKSTPEKPGVEE